MKHILTKLLILTVIFGLARAFFINEDALAAGQKGCPCCATGKCHSSKSCHEPIKACLCRHPVLQVFLPQTTFSPQILFAGFVTQASGREYLFLYPVDIFHPPRTISYASS